MLPHGGTDTRIWREVVELGRTLPALGELRGTRVEAEVAMVWDWESWWALELAWRPSVDLDYRERVEAYYTALWRDQHHRRLRPPRGGPWPLPHGGRAESLPDQPEAAAKNLDGVRRAAAGRWSSRTSPAIVDAHDSAYTRAAYPGALRDVLGLTVEEFLPLRAGERVTVTGGLSAEVWTEDLRLRGASATHQYLDGPAAGQSAITRHQVGAGVAWYVSCRLDGPGVRAVLDLARQDAQLGVCETPAGVELVRRTGGGRTYLIAINHTAAAVQVAVSGHDLLADAPCAALDLPAGAVRVVRCAQPAA